MSARILSGMARVGLAALAAVFALAAMSQPSAAQGVAKPAAAAPPAASSDAAAKLAKGRELFGNYGCGSCHSLGDAGATGHVGPSLDGDPNLSEAFIVTRVTNGQGGMPAFGDQLSKDDIAAIASYVTQVAGR